MSLAQYIDHTLLKQTATLSDIDQLCHEAAAYQFAAVCVPPVYVHHAVQELGQSRVKVATVIGFPLGYSYTQVKCTEAEQAIDHGAQELDMVMNIGALKNGDDNYLEDEVATVLAVTQKSNTILKIIVESGVLTERELIRCCEIYKNYPVHFIKTSTGYAEKGATVEAVQLLRKQLPSHIQIKASGGIKTSSFAQQLIQAGATRLGCSASVAIINGEASGKNDY